MMNCEDGETREGIDSDGAESPLLPSRQSSGAFFTYIYSRMSSYMPDILGISLFLRYWLAMQEVPGKPIWR